MPTNLSALDRDERIRETQRTAHVESTCSTGQLRLRRGWLELVDGKRGAEHIPGTAGKSNSGRVVNIASPTVTVGDPAVRTRPREEN